MGEAIAYDEVDGIGVLRMDDGKANAIQTSWCRKVNEVLDRAEASDISALVVTGRPGFFSGGLDIKILSTLKGAELRETTDLFVETMRRIFLFPKPIVAASNGHAIAGGLMLMLAADIRFAVDDDRHRYGLNEATTGVPLLGGTVGICLHSIPPAHHNELILHGRILSARQCFERQIVRELVASPEALEELAIARALELRDVELGAYRLNKLILRRGAFQAGVEIAESLMSEAPQHNVFLDMKT